MKVSFLAAWHAEVVHLAFHCVWEKNSEREDVKS